MGLSRSYVLSPIMLCSLFVLLSSCLLTLVIQNCSGLLFLKLHLPDLSRPVRAVRIKAAYTSGTNDNHLYMFTDREIILVQDRVERIVFPLSRLTLPSPFTVEAAWNTRAGGLTFYSRRRGFFTHGREQSRILNYGQYRRFLRSRRGADAAARRGQNVFVFRGCEFVIRYHWRRWSNVRNVLNYGLPCNIHAAWREGASMVLLRGDQIWRWNGDGSVTGPTPFLYSYKLEHFNLLPYPQSTM